MSNLASSQYDSLHMVYMYVEYSSNYLISIRYIEFKKKSLISRFDKTSTVHTELF